MATVCTAHSHINAVDNLYLPVGQRCSAVCWFHNGQQGSPMEGIVTVSSHKEVSGSQLSKIQLSGPYSAFFQAAGPTVSLISISICPWKHVLPLPPLPIPYSATYTSNGWQIFIFNTWNTKNLTS